LDAKNHDRERRKRIDWFPRMENFNWIETKFSLANGLVEWAGGNYRLYFPLRFILFLRLLCVCCVILLVDIVSSILASPLFERTPQCDASSSLPSAADI
jgi:hypothetical protein